MRKLLFKATTGIATAGLLASLLATGVSADNEISGNGEGTHNTITQTQANNCTVEQSNKMEVTTEAEVTANSGSNQANGNTNGNVTIDTGDASATLMVTVGGGSNDATDPCCCKSECQGPDTDNEIKNNVKNSTNTITDIKASTKNIKQKNKTKVGTAALVKAKTGKNKANGNTGSGKVEVKTGDADSLLEVTVDPPSNTLNN